MPCLKDFILYLNPDNAKIIHHGDSKLSAENLQMFGPPSFFFCKGVGDGGGIVIQNLLLIRFKLCGFYYFC